MIVGIAPTDQEFQQAFGEPLSGLLNITGWQQGGDLASLYARLHEHVSEATELQRRSRRYVREAVFPSLKGVYKLTPEQVEECQAGLLFNGATEACDGTVLHHDSLVLTVTQIGFSLVAYQGSHGKWVQRLYRRDLTERITDPRAEADELLRRRARREADIEEPRDRLARLARRGLMDYAERAALGRLSTAIWRMGHGEPIPSNLLIPASPELVRESISVMRELFLQHRKFVFVTSESADRLALHIGDALEPLEFAIIGDLEVELSDNRLAAIAGSQYGHAEENRLISQFIAEARSQLVCGVYRVAEHAPPHIFRAHKDHACEAAAIAMADSALQPLRGFPMLIDLADLVCRHTFDSASFTGTLRDAYGACGEPARYMGERETRS